MSTPTDIEKESLEAHVELCAIRYNTLEKKLDEVEKRIDKLESLILDIRESVTNTDTDNKKNTISIFTSVLTALLAGLLGFISKGIFH